MSQHLRRGMLAVVPAIAAAIASVGVRWVRLGFEMHGERSLDARMHPDGEAFRGSHHARRAPLARVMAAAAAVLLAAAACAGEPRIQSRGPSPPPGGPAPSSTVTSSSPSPSDTARYPNLSRFNDAFDRFAYKSAYSDCRFIGVDATAEAFGGDPDDPRSVARAYAVATFPQSVEHREATLQGCLDAFETGAQ